MLPTPLVTASSPPTPLRSPTASGRAYPAEIVAGVRGLVEDEGLSYRAAAALSGIREGLVGEWARRFGWRRGGVSGAVGRVTSPRWGEVERTEGAPGEGVALFPERLSPVTLPSPRRGEGSRASPPSPQARGMGRPTAPYGPEIHEVARVRVEESRVGLERIANELGIGRQTLIGWQKRFGWRRPEPPKRYGAPPFYRSRRWGRPYGGDAVGTARDLVTGSTLPLRRIAAQAGVSRATLCRWMVERGWERHPAVPKAGRREPYGPAVVDAARELYTITELSTRMIAARVKTTPERVAFWAKRDGWTRPRDQEDPYGRLPRRRRKRPPSARRAAAEPRFL